jgi:hypothetical protein
MWAVCIIPARNDGKDLRHATGYQEKCSRETCAACRAFAQLTPKAQDILIGMCQGMDSFSYSSFSLNPVMRLLAFGPAVAEDATLLVSKRDELEDWLWLSEAPPAWVTCWPGSASPKVPRYSPGRTLPATWPTWFLI